MRTQTIKQNIKRKTHTKETQTNNIKIILGNINICIIIISQKFEGNKILM